MLTIVWGVTGFHVVKLLPKGGIFNPSYCIDEIVSEIASWREAQKGSTTRKLVVHADNARPHTAGRTVRHIAACGIVRAPHPPFSPNLAPSDFFPFGYLKSMLPGRHFETGEELLAAIPDLLCTTENVTLETAFLE
jgi:histone-lysine N-methyltransferase SETMAR